jgi:hypothetical protein
MRKGQRLKISPVLDRSKICRGPRAMAVFEIA